MLELKQLARTNRKTPTKAESLVWNLILKNDLLGYRFLRQKPIDRFILDFYCPKLLLAIEVDGDSHIGKVYYDQGRDLILKSIGIKTVRFRNEDILKHLTQIKNKIILEIQNRINEI